MTGSSSDVAAVIDDLITTDIGGRGTISPITEATRSRQGETPSMQAARALAEHVEPGDTVYVLTGFLIPPTMVQETDGPLGAVSVARAVDEALDANPVIACDPPAVEICSATARAGGLSVLERPTSLGSKRSVTVEPFPSDPENAGAYADDVLADPDLSAVIAVEKVAPNRAGVYHNMAGYDVTEATAKVDELYDRVDDVLTVAVGDAGNEVGMGLVEDVVRSEIQYGDECQCDCSDGIAAAIETDHLVPATVSNWGGYAITASLSAIVDRRLLHDPDTERRMLSASTMAGAIDGIVGGTDPWCDGLPPASHEAVVQLLHEILDSSVHARGGGELGR